MNDQAKFTISGREYDAVIFDLDGVVTKTAKLHAAAWKDLFDAYLKGRAAQNGMTFRPFDAEEDYIRYVDGRPRYEGVKSFLESRNIKLPYGKVDDGANRETICGLENGKNDIFQRCLERNDAGIEVYDSSIELIEALRVNGIKTAVASSSKNCVAILKASKISGLFDEKIDGIDSEKLNLNGKPAPDIFLKSADVLHVDPMRAIVVENAIAGVQAGHKGHFGCVIGVDRTGQATALVENGADVVVKDLGEVAVGNARSKAHKDRLQAAWSLIYEDFDPKQEGLREALCTLGNGYFATRGAAAESTADNIHYPGTYIAGGYNRLRTEVAGRVVENEDLVNFPNWLSIKFRIAGEQWFNLMAVEILSYRQGLDLRKGILTRTVRFRDKRGRVSHLVNRRFVSMSDSHLAGIETTLIAENWSGKIEVHSALDGRVVNAGVERYKGLNNKHLEPLRADAVDDDIISLQVQTNQSGMRVAQAARTLIFANGQPVAVNRRTYQESGYIAHRFAVDVTQGSEIRIEKIVTLFTSRDHTISECGVEAKRSVTRAACFDELMAAHIVAWGHLWRRCHIDIELSKTQESEDTALILHLHAFHLLQVASPHTINLGIGVPARGWHGEAYRGHIFWDELFVFPVLNLHFPEVSRALLLYRYRCLAEARAAANRAGYRGAMYPWQSASDGREETQQLHLNPRSGRWLPDNTHLQRHVSSAIAYNVWHYFEATHDMEFLSSYGAEMILEIARFWASIANYNQEHDRFEILGIMGPDEYHDSYSDGKTPGLNNNAYTNVLAAWVFARALEALKLLPADRRKELCETLGLHQEEYARWKDMSEKMRVVFHDENIISQYEGYDRLEEFDWEGYEKKYGKIQRLDRILEAEGDTPNRYKVSKQADTLMLFYLFSYEELCGIFKQLGYLFDRDIMRKNIEYYLARTSHGSTLSEVVHSWILAHVDREASWQRFMKALESDIRDIQGGTTPEGIHLGSMTGTVGQIQRGYAGIETRNGILWLDPNLPAGLSRIHMEVRYLGHVIELKITHDKLRVRVRWCAGKPAQFSFRGVLYSLEKGDSKEFQL